MSNFPGHGTYFLLLNGCGYPNHPPGNHASVLNHPSFPQQYVHPHQPHQPPTYGHPQTIPYGSTLRGGISTGSFYSTMPSAPIDIPPRRLRPTCGQILSYPQTITRTMLLFFHTQVDASPIKPQLKEVHGPSTSINSNLALKHHNLLAMVLHSLDCCPKP
jgi:hypothetical protein